MAFERRGGIEKIGIVLENPKTFLPLLLFIGFVFTLIGFGMYNINANSDLIATGLIVIVIAIGIFSLMNRDRMF